MTPKEDFFDRITYFSFQAEGETVVPLSTVKAIINDMNVFSSPTSNQQLDNLKEAIKKIHKRDIVKSLEGNEK